jgi:hypothetical protein
MYSGVPTSWVNCVYTVLSVNCWHAPLADLLHELVRADDSTGAFGDDRFIDGSEQAMGGALHEVPRLLMGFEESLDLRAQSRVGSAGEIEIRRPLFAVIDFQCGKENGTLGHG